MKINANDQLDLRGFCLSGCDNETTIFTYNFYMFNTTCKTSQKFSNSSYYYYTGVDPQTDLTVKEDLFQDYASQIVWNIELVVFLPNKNVTGSASILFFVNYPPRNGQCDINPKNGSTETLFSISCWNWFDSDGNLDSYAYYGLSFFLNIY